jgi:ribosome-associated protein
MTNDPSIDIYVKAALGKKVINPVVLDVSELTSFTDVFIICSGQSSRQVAAIGSFIKENLKASGIQPISVEGMREGQWVLMDYGHVVIHVFYGPVREFYDLEGLWMDAKRIKTKSLIKAEQNMQDSGEFQ